MSRVLVIGCGGVASVAISKCCQASEVFTELMIASRTKSKCDALAEKLRPTTKTVITTAQVNADNVDDILKTETGLVFSKVLEHAGVFKRDGIGTAAFIRFAESVK